MDRDSGRSYLSLRVLKIDCCTLHDSAAVGIPDVDPISLACCPATQAQSLLIGLWSRH